MSRSHHDQLFKATYRDPRNLAALLRQNLPAALVEQLDFRCAEEIPGTFLDPNLSERCSDLLFRLPVAGRESFVYVLAEHQSTPSPLMGLRLLIYMGRIWDRWLRQQRAKARAHEGAPPRRVPAILPLVVFQGPGGWSPSTAFTDLIDLPPEQLDAVRTYLPTFRYALENLGQVTDDELRARGLSPLGTIGLVLLKHARDKRERFLRSLAGLMDLFRTLGADDQVTILSYTVEVVDFSSLREVKEVFAGDLSPKLEEAIMTLSEKLRTEGRVEGRVEGRAEGELAGRRKLLWAQLHARFPNQMSSERSALVQNATLTQLDAWGVRFATATTIDEVFSE